MATLLQCPDAETLELLFSGELATDVRAAIADHAAGCHECYQLVDLLLDSDALATTAAPSAAVARPELHAPPRALQAGAAIDRYLIERRIGHGGMGVVYAARDPELGRRIAIKVLRAGSPAERLRREAQALAKLSHPNVVAIHDVGEHDGQTFIAMALVDGVTLRTWLETPRRVAEIVEVLRASGRGIAAAHAAGMIHRDLKPDNIFIAHDGGVLVGDFGLAREAHAGDAEIAGTPAYMAPEQAQGAATAASDQFAFCVTAWEALYAERPFAGTTLTTLQASIQAGTIRAPTDARVPAKIVRALRRGLETDPAERFPSMVELLAELAPPRRRWPWVVGALAAAGLATTAPLAFHATQVACDTSHLLDAVRGAPLAGAPGAALDGYATRWLAARHDVCTMRDELGPAVADARAACLEQRRAAFGVVRGSLASDTDADGALQAIDRLPSIDACTHVAPEVATPARLASRATLAVRLADLETRYLLARSPPQSELLAFADDAERAGDAAMMASALLLVGAELQDAGDPTGAESIIRRALLVAERAREDHASIDARLDLARTLIRLQRLTETHNVLDEAATVLARYGVDRDLELDLVRARSELASAEGDHAKAIELLRTYIAGHEATGESIRLAFGYIELMGELSEHGDPAEAAAVARKFRALERTLGLPDVETRTLETEATAAEELGDFGQAIELEERALAITRGNPHDAATEARALFSLSNAYELGSEWEKWRTTNELRLPLLADAEVAERASVMDNIGTAYARLGQATRAIEWLEKAIALFATTVPSTDATNARVTLALELVQAGRTRDARVLCEELLPPLVAAAPKMPWRQGTVEATLARTLWDQGDAHDRSRALVLAADAERDFLAGLAYLEKYPIATNGAATVRSRLAELRAWRAHHEL